MKQVWVALVAILLVPVIGIPIIYTQYIADNSSHDLFFGVSFGANSVQDAQVLIDKVKEYTNLFLVDSYDVSLNESVLTEICDYAVNAKLSTLTYFDFILYNVTSNVGAFYNTSTWEEYEINPFHVQWLNNARERWGNKFLGVYLADEPGGNQIDRGYWGGNNASRSGRPIQTFENVTDYTDAANRYISGINRTRSMQILTNTSYPNGLTRAMPVFTSDYALYWFDYKAGYDTILAQIGGNGGTNSKIQQIALCRGAANMQNKEWGTIITWATDNPPYLESGADMLQDMKMAYNAGAKYIIIFNYPLLNDYGALTEEHFEAMKTFWHYVQNNPRTTDKSTHTAFVLPKDYGWGMRRPDDRIWGLWPADNLSIEIWDKMMTLIDQYCVELDIIYDDSDFNIKEKYSQVYYWNDTIG